MYSWVPDRALEMLRYRRLPRIPSAWRGVAAYRVTRSSKVDLGVEHEGPQLAGRFPVAVDQAGLVGQTVQAQGVGQPFGRIDGDHAGATAETGTLHGDGGGNGRLAHAARAGSR